MPPSKSAREYEATIKKLEDKIEELIGYARDLEVQVHNLEKKNDAS